MPNSRYGWLLAMIGCAAFTTGAARQPAGAASGEIRVIFQADDMAAGHGINVATIEAYRNGVVRSANVIVNGPWLPEAARLLNENPGLDAGVHLALTSEWDLVKWRPLTTAPSLVDASGFFFSMVRPRPGSPTAMSISEGKPDIGEIEKELRAQIGLAKRLIPHLTYTWEHMGFGSLSPDVRALVRKLTKEHGLIAPGPEMGIQFLGRVWERPDAGEVRAEKLAAKLASLGPGTWLMVEHAATDTPEIRAFGHPGYEDVAADRSAVLYAWTSPKVMDVVRKRGIELTNYREIATHAP